MARVVMVILGLIALVGWTVARASIKAGIRLMRERDEARAALERFGKLTDDNGVFVRVHVDALRSVVDWVNAESTCDGLDFDDLYYLEERLRTVTR